MNLNLREGGKTVIHVYSLEERDIERILEIEIKFDDEETSSILNKQRDATANV